MKALNRVEPSLAGLETLLASARTLVDKMIRDPLLHRLIDAFFNLPKADREPILKVVERDSAWRRIVQETSGSTGIDVRPNPHASLYMHVFDETPQPLPRDVEAIRLGIERFVHLLPLFYQEGVREQWMRSARELIIAANPELRAVGVRLAQDVMALIAEITAEPESP